MLQYVIVGLIIALAVTSAVLKLIKAFRKKKNCSGCAGCSYQQDCNKKQN